jgi:hypothetical protein
VSHEATVLCNSFMHVVCRMEILNKPPERVTRFIQDKLGIRTDKAALEA